MSRPVVDIGALPQQVVAPPNSARFGASIAEVGEALPPMGLGAMYVTVAPGKRAFPFHNHLAADEMFLILEGVGTYRFGADEYPVRAGDICGAPKGGAETAHQLINTGETSLRYLGISTMEDPDVVEYPDSNKFSVVAIAPGPDFWQAHLNFKGRREMSLDYWDGEEL